MTISFSIDDLRKTLPRADALAGLEGDALLQALTRLRGSMAEDAVVSFDGMDQPGIRGITYEIAALGMKGLDVNSTSKKYRITSLAGDFSGLQLLCLEYVGFKILDPSVEIGFDLSREYEMARQLHLGEG